MLVEQKKNPNHSNTTTTHFYIAPSEGFSNTAHVIKGGCLHKKKKHYTPTNFMIYSDDYYYFQ